MLNTIATELRPAYFRIDGSIDGSGQWFEDTDVLLSITRWLR